MNLFTSVLFLVYFGHSGHRSGHWDEDTTGIVALSMFLLPWLIAIPAGIYWTVVWYEMKPKYFFNYFKPLNAEYKTILSQKFNFYKKLPASQKKSFEKRLNHFLINKKITSEYSSVVTDEMKVLIAASCTQLTFGLRPNYLSHFESIKVLQDEIDWRKTVKSPKQIVIPWHEFMLGYNVSDDGYNPGLEIMAMAISIEDRIGKKAGYIFGENEYLKWNRISRIHAEALISMKVTQFNNYKEVNKDEYFAIAVVSFFEQPENFKDRFPDMYNCMVQLLKQNPLKYK